MKVKLEELMDPKWAKIIDPILRTPEMQKGFIFIREDKLKGPVYPDTENIFNAFKLTPWDDIKIVILGQDPYHGTTNIFDKTVPQATGLSFGIPGGSIKMPPSLRNIEKELEREYDFTKSFGFDQTMEKWAKQGVLMLNTALTVRKGDPGSHTRHWAYFTERLLRYLADYKTGVIYLLWGRHAQKYKKFMDTKKNHILETSHPSPFSVDKGFDGCDHFKKANELIKKMNGEDAEINW